MEISRGFLFACAIIVWCFLDKVHSASITPSTIPPVTTPLTIPPITPSTIPSVTTTPSTNPPVTTPSIIGNFSQCGQSKKVAELIMKIAGGENVSLRSWPWMVALYIPTGRTTEPKFKFNCGASLISNQWVVTAAHCLTSYNKSDILLRLGDLDINDQVKDGASPVNVTIDKIVKHPEAAEESNATTNDIALLRLEKPIKFEENIRPICLLSGKKYKTNEYYNKKQAFIIGWGDLGEGKPPSSRLQETTVNVTKLQKCAQQYAGIKTIKIDDNVICARGPGKDTCKGDSGGPLMLFKEESFYLAGITSTGRGCAREEFPGVYVKVAQYISWINKVTGGKF